MQRRACSADSLLDKIKPATSRLRSVLFRGANFLVSVLLILLVTALFYKDYTFSSAITKELVKSSPPSNSIVATGHGSPISNWRSVPAGANW
ncbi:phosphoethanolamine transferase domain-containing protein [Shigella flexneri]